MKNMIVRALTSVIYVCLLVGCVLFSPVTSFVFFGLVTVLALYEFGTIVNNYGGASLHRPMNALAGLLLVAAIWLYCVGSDTTGKMFCLYGFTLLYLLIAELYRGSSSPLRNWSLCFASQLYVALPFSLVPFISVAYENGTVSPAYTWIYTLSLFIFLWTNDTGAYLCGLALHNYFPAKLFPRISPKKTWVGSIGGGISTLAISVLMWHCTSGTLSLSEWLGFALIVILFGTWGDLVESLLKRELGIKDSGRILPGHGGMLDRFDSALLAIPASVVYLYLVASIG